MSLLSLTGVVAGYGGGNVLQGVDIDVDAGSVTCIVGPNGAGKSTVLRAISGLLRPSAGSIEFDGKGLVDMSCAQVLATGIVQVPQHDALFGSMTVKENVMMGGYLLRRDRALLKRRYALVEELVPLLRERPQEKAGNLSGGQRRMIEIGRTLMLQPTLILMDEPSLGLEPRAVKQVSDLISAANREGRTILLVEQNVRLGFKMATHGIIMERGKVRTAGAPQSLLDDPELADLYLGGTSVDAPSERPTRRSPEAQTGHG
jgi:ABC-type branched-subunit amino acid transport system ATPase component